MFFRYNTEPARLLRLFRAFRNQPQRLRRYRNAYLTWLGMAVLLYWVVTLLIWLWADSAHPLPGQHGPSPHFGEYFLFFSAAGSVYLLLAWGWSAVFTTYPRKRHGLGFKAIGIFMLGFASVWLTVMLSAWWDGLSPDPLNLLRQPAQRMEVWLPWAWSGLGLFLVSRAIVWLRLKAVFVENYELDFLYRTLKPLLRDLPPDALCSLTCNPFHAMWTVEFKEVKARGRSFRTYDDVLLDFKAKLSDGAVFVLRTLHRRTDKYKIRKSKFKGSKHRIAQVYRMELAAAAPLDEAEYKRFVQLGSQWQDEANGYESTLRQQAQDGGLSLTVAQKKKFRSDGELAPDHLPSAALTLQTVRALSDFAAARRALKPPSAP